MAITSVVTGGAGFLGRHLVAALRGRGDQVLVLDVREPEERLPGARYRQGSVTDPERVRDVVRHADRLFHLAARTGLWTEDRDEYHQVNVEGARTVFRVALEEGVDRVVHTSTEAILRDFDAAGSAAWSRCRTGPRKRTPTHDLRAETLPSAEAVPAGYCRSKVAGEREAVRALERGLPVVVVNPTVPVGPGDPGRTPPSRMLLGFLRGRFPAFLEGPVDIVDIRDLARGHLLAAQPGAPAGVRYVLGGTRLRMSRLLELLEAIAGVEMPRWRMPYPVALLAGAVGELAADLVTGRPPSATVAGVRLVRAPARFDPERSRRRLGLSVRPVRETLSDTVRWFRDRGLLDGDREGG